VLQDLQEVGSRAFEARRVEPLQGPLGRHLHRLQVLAGVPLALRVCDRRRDRGQPGVDPREEVLGLRPAAALHPAHPGLLRPQPLELSHVLRAVHAAAGRGELVDRLAHQRVDPGGRQRQGWRVTVEEGGAVEGLWGPGGEPLGGELRQGRGIAGERERLVRRHPGRLVLPVGGRGHAGEDGDDHLRLEAAHHPHDVFEQHLLGPEAQRLLERAGEAEVVGAGEELPAAVDRAGGEQLAAADEPQALPELRADQVLPALSPAEREVRRLAPHAAGDQGEERGVLVVRMGRDHQQPLVGGQLLERPLDHRHPSG
jgi:hypothetical protein